MRKIGSFNHKGTYLNVWAGRKSIIKYPTKLRNLPQLKHELHNNNIARLDPFWGQYVAPMRSVAGLAGYSRRLHTMATPQQFDSLGASLKSRIDTISGSLEDIVIPEGLEQILSQMNTKAREALLTRTTRPLPLNSAHGDLHKDNLFIHNDKLVIIDWEYYTPLFWAGYDLMHTTIVEGSTGEGASWGQYLLTTQALHNLSDIFAEEEQRNAIDLYAICRASLEAAKDVRCGNLNRLKKYVNILNRVFLQT